jgi:hypothetical protein
MSTKISQLTSATDITASDLMQVVDVEDGVMAPSGTNKKVTASLLAKELAKQPLEPGIVISGSSSGDAVRITQTGSGNALVVEDSTNPDSTPFIIDSSGKCTIGKTTATGTALLQIFSESDVEFRVRKSAENILGSICILQKARGTTNSPSAVLNGDQIGRFVFEGHDGISNCEAASIRCHVDGTPETDSVPGRLTFVTTPDGSSSALERMRITNSGNVGIGTDTPTAKLSVVDNSSSDALRITQTGTGNALLVEDSANPDATPTVIDTTGRVIVGHTSGLTSALDQNPYIQTISTNTNGVAGGVFGAFNYRADTSGGGLSFNKSRATTPGTNAIVSSGDNMGVIRFAGDDGVAFIQGALISADVDGTPGTNDMPGRLVFGTTADGAVFPTERMRITSAGNVGIATTTPSSKLHVAGDLTMSSATVATSATAGTNGDVPAQVEGYLVVNINGTARKIPYYA